MSFLSKLRSFRRDERGVVTVEWVAAAAIMVLAGIITFTVIGNNAKLILDEVDVQLQGSVDAITP